VAKSTPQKISLEAQENSSVEWKKGKIRELFYWVLENQFSGL
jgi:two-component SAPR family response regulator